MKRLLTLAAFFAAAGPATAADPAPAIAMILAVGREGTGNEEAAAAWKRLVAGGADALVPTLTAFDAASPAAANWLRSAVTAVADAEAAANRPLPAAALKGFVQDVKRKPAARRIAFELYTAAKPDDAKNLLAELVNDPDADLRREAIVRTPRPRRQGRPGGTARRAEGTHPVRPRPRPGRRAGQGSRQGGGQVQQDDPLQLRHAVARRSARSTTPARPGTGRFSRPESGFAAKAEFAGKSGPVTWKAMQSGEEYGSVSLNAEYGKVKSALAYAYAVIDSPAATPVEVRATSPNALQIFLNGERIYARDAYHNGSWPDAHVGKGALKAGRNELLLKVCQDDQKPAWAQGWEFAARLCDATGGRVLLQQVLTEPTGETRLVPLGLLKSAPAEEKK